MVKITLEFPNVDQAIVALGKLALLKPAASDKVTVANPRQPSEAELKAREGVPATKARKSRADKGQPRGKYNKDAGASAPAGTPSSVASSNGASAVTDPRDGGQQALTVESTPAPAPKAEQSAATNAPAPTEKEVQTATAYGRSIGGPAELHNLPKAGPAPTATQEEVQTAIEALFSAKDINVTRAVLGRFGAKRGQDLLPEHRAAFIALANDVREGKAQP